jgi:hypothetical protein
LTIFLSIAIERTARALARRQQAREAADAGEPAAASA